MSATFQVHEVEKVDVLYKTFDTFTVTEYTIRGKEGQILGIVELFHTRTPGQSFPVYETKHADVST